MPGSAFQDAEIEESGDSATKADLEARIAELKRQVAYLEKKQNNHHQYLMEIAFELAAKTLESADYSMVEEYEDEFGESLSREDAIQVHDMVMSLSDFIPVNLLSIVTVPRDVFEDFKSKLSFAPGMVSALPDRFALVVEDV